MGTVVIILGYKLTDNGEPEKEMKGRVNKGIKIFREKKAGKIILAGGMANPEAGKTEAKVMARIASSKGINTKEMILEEESLDTIGNAYFSKRIIKEYNWRKAYVVTSCYHVERASFIFEMVYGNKFELNFEHCYSSGKEDFEKETLEGGKIEEAKRFFKGMKPGDDKELECRIFNKHELYRKTKRRRS